jgi:NAD-dependent dihydropyrimidine dehydrogenase PreA subunit
MELRRLIVETLLSQCPGADALRKIAAELGLVKPRFPVSGAPEDKCILCGLCVRVCEEIIGAGALSLVGRGIERKVGTAFEAVPDVCIGCGACAAVCPTGAIDMEKEAVDAFREKEGDERLCRYALLGLAPAALCANSFECYRCPVDQGLRDKLKIHPALHAGKMKREVSSMQMEEGAKE